MLKLGSVGEEVRRLQARLKELGFCKGAVVIMKRKEYDTILEKKYKEVVFMRLQLTIEAWKKGDWYLARTPELDFISQGRTQEEAKKNLLEVIRIQFKEMIEMNTLKDYLMECGYEIKDDDIIPHTEMVQFEKSVVSV